MWFSCSSAQLHLQRLEAKLSLWETSQNTPGLVLALDAALVAKSAVQKTIPSGEMGMGKRNPGVFPGQGSNTHLLLQGVTPHVKERELVGGREAQEALRLQRIVITEPL